jgi:hypothetical protein
MRVESMSEPRMIRDIQRDEDHDETIDALTNRIDELEDAVEAKPISFSVKGFFAFIIVISMIAYYLPLVLKSLT